MTGISGAELTARRLASLDRYYALKLQREKESMSVKYEHDRHVINAQMATESFLRDQTTTKRQK